MTRSHTCRHCLAFGLLASVLIHAATWHLAWRIVPPPPPLPPMVAIDLDLAVFADAPGGAGAPGADEPVLTGPAPSDAAPTPEPPEAAPSQPAPPAPPAAPADPTPAVADAPATLPALQPAPVASVQPAPVRAIKPPPPAEPKRRQEPKRTKPKPVPATPKTKPKPEPKPKPEARSAAKPAREPRPEPPESARTQTSPRQAATPASTLAASPRKQTAPAAASTGTRPKSADGSTAGAAARPATGATSAAAERAYLAELQRAISRHQQFPEAARQRRKTGVATVAFVVTADGRITQARISKSSGDPDLDQAAVATLNRLGRFKPIPAAIGRTSWPMRVPIRFDLR